MTIKGRHTVDLFVVNEKAFDITVTLTFKLDNMTVDPIRPLTETYSGHSQTRAVRLSAIDKDKKWTYRYTTNWIEGSLYAQHDADQVYRLPWRRGEAYPVSQTYNGEYSHNDDSRYAIDFSMPEGTTVCAAREGLVVGVKQDSAVSGLSKKKYGKQGNRVLIVHDDGTIAFYYHLQFGGVMVSQGDYVRAGQPIALSGDTGFSSGAHLHFGVYRAVNGKRRQSFPIRFATRRGIIDTPVKGIAYRVP